MRFYLKDGLRYLLSLLAAVEGDLVFGRRKVLVCLFEDCIFEDRLANMKTIRRYSFHYYYSVSIASFA